MEFSQLLEMAKAGKKIPNKDWAKLTSEQKQQVKEARSAAPDKNDWRYYAISEQIARDFGSLPYNVLSGVGFDLTAEKMQFGSLGQHPTTAVVSFSEREMSVLRLNCVLGPGWTTTKTEGINMAAAQVYTAIRRRNSGAKNYEAADAMLYILGMKEVYALYWTCSRMLKTAGLFAIENHNLPETLLFAMAVDSDDLVANIANYRGRLNLLASKINALAVPKYFTAFKRDAFILSNIFADSTSMRGQMYLYLPNGYRTYSPKTSEKGGELVYADVDNTAGKRWTFNQYLDRLSSMIDALFLDDDVNTISGDILKEFGSENLFSVPEVGENEVVRPVYDEDALAQIENSTAAGTFVPNNTTGSKISWNITQSDQLLVYKPTFSDYVANVAPMIQYIPTSLIFNSHKDAPDFRDNLEWSRCMTVPVYTQDTSGNSQVELHSGNETITSYSLIQKKNSSLLMNNLIDLTPEDHEIAAILKLMQYDWHPILYFPWSNGSSIDSMAIGGDLKKYTVVNSGTISDMHNAANSALYWSTAVYKAQTPSDK